MLIRVIKTLFREGWKCENFKSYFLIFKTIYIYTVSFTQKFKNINGIYTVVFYIPLF